MTSANQHGKRAAPRPARRAVAATHTGHSWEVRKALAAEEELLGGWQAANFEAGHPDKAALEAARDRQWKALAKNWRRVLRLDPSSLIALTRLGLLLEQMGENEEALIMCQRAACAVESSLPGAEAPFLNGVGALLTRLGRHDEAAAVTQRELSLLQAAPLPEEPHQAAGVLTLFSSALERLGLHDEALYFADAAFRSEDNDETRRTLGRALLRLGHTGRGYRVWSGRARSLEQYLGTGAKRWDGSARTNGSRLRVCTWEGLGDAIQYVRYLPLMLSDAPLNGAGLNNTPLNDAVTNAPAHAGNSILMVCDDGTDRLFRSLEAACPPGRLSVLPWSQHRAAHLASVEPEGSAASGNGFRHDKDWHLKDWDLDASLDDFPAYFATRFGDGIPAPEGYLRAAPEDAERLKPFLPQREERPLRVGLVWRGNPVHTNDGNRSLPLSALAPLAAVPGVDFFALQKGEAAEAEEAPPGMRLTRLSPHLRDLADTAAAMTLLDLVISVDSSPCHLAGALGVPVWTLLPELADWRWQVSREDSPWYSSMRLFRQRMPGDWLEVIERVAAALTSVAAQREEEGKDNDDG